MKSKDLKPTKKAPTKKLLYRGKTKDVYQLDNKNILLKFKDTVTGDANTNQLDPGGNQVVGTIKGIGSSALAVTTYYFTLLKNKKTLSQKPLLTHFVSSNLQANEMIVKPATMFGHGVEVIVRNILTGSFIKRYGMYATDGTVLKTPIIEFTLKDDKRNDPLISQDVLDALHLLTIKQSNEIKELALNLNRIVKNDLKKKNAILYDIKFEFGLINGKITLIDEISGGNMRVYKDSKKLSYEELSKLILNK